MIMKKTYQVPTSYPIEIQTGGIIALSLQNGSENSVTDSNKNEFEQLSNKRESIWGDDANGSLPW